MVRVAIRKTLTKGALVGLAGTIAITGLALAQSLGALFPLTGGLQIYGEVAVNGARLAVDEVNAAGGIMGKQINFEVADSQTTPQGGVEGANRLVNLNSVFGIVGPMASSVTLPVALSVAKNVGVPVISPSATAPTLTDADDNDILFRTAPSDAAQGVVLADEVWREGIKNVAVFYQNDDYGVGLAQSFQKAFVRLGGSISALAFEPKQASYRSELRSLSRAGQRSPDRRLLLIAFPNNGGTTILRQAIEEGYFQRFIMTDGMKSEALLELANGDTLADLIGTAPRGVETEAVVFFRNAYTRQFGKPPEQPFIDTSYDAAMVLMLAAASAQSFDRAKIQEHIRLVSTPAPGALVVGPGQVSRALEALAQGRRINYEGVSGSVDFDHNGDVGGSYEVWTIDNGAFVTKRLIHPS